ncbi:sialate O-acetylesterase, partial [Akkermansiaceae bacterium]|nr:sialate O-acetylesterase [Akkermansiaceae bacterium]
ALFLASLILQLTFAGELVVTSPLNEQIFQRSTSTHGPINITGSLPQATHQDLNLEARLDENSWIEITNLPAGKSKFTASLKSISPGWHRLELRARSGDAILHTASVNKVGVGEVFLIAGQSNSANHGEKKLTVQSGMVTSFDGTKWQIANDPQGGASGRGGSFIPPFGDEMAKRFGVPIGIVSIGSGGTSIREWLPKGARFPNPPTVLNKVTQLPNGEWESNGTLFDKLAARLHTLGPNGFRAVLWHQGESDAKQRDPNRTLPGVLYQKYLTQLINESNRIAAWQAPWFVAQASYHTPEDPGSPDLRAAQKALWESGTALEGPDTDALGGANRDNKGKGVHFSSLGQRNHGLAWAEKVSPWLAQQLGPIQVFILAGQSNMEGQGVVSMDHENHYNGGKGNLVWSMQHSASKDRMKHLKDAEGHWVEREDVMISFKARDKVRKGKLTIGYTGYGNYSHIGPELQIGHLLGDHFKQPVLLIKTAWGGKSLHQDFRPPSASGDTGEYYLKMIQEIRAALDNQAYQLCGFIWMQGWNDMVSKEATDEYADNLVLFAKDLRAEFQSPTLPIVIGELGNDGPAKEGSGMQLFRIAQRAGTKNIPHARFVETAAFARPKELSPNTGHGHHWYGNAESYFLVGDALGREMIRSLEAR